MSRFSLRRMAAVGVSAALLGTGVTVGLGTGVASAAFNADTCTTSVTAKTGASKDYSLTKTIEGDGTVASDGTVAVRLTLSGPGGMVYELRDFHADDFRMIKTELNVGWVAGGQKWEDVTDRATRSDGAIRMGTTGGWTTAGKTVALRIKYKAPTGILPGQKIDAMGAGANIGVIGGNKDFGDMNVCMTGRIPNPIEAIGGSLGSMGLGSIADLGGEFTGSFTDPSSPLLGSVSGSLGSASGS